ncbi:Septal ring factor EnvC, activator of murein hydrolases AmiA and AmiB [Desulfacinum hydrothermale DSM 13146]|uniref:Septal ring factor EnvC, activator of murein hydrolases AmiA and AmiB n=1 Tax=Desulfacinum hydrothermale DSM 13146 TaxID=1121390 RepID=A0A1W1XLQ2_9BACT|nr:peptidoglycan DD-metalloendopeptidase family protein [Desulfacinum hydrothermale]SMC24856.1 Septal ring factor EnvC, activator of murein hydrolases AmiA and AmiB [Desulfacinum hydrothermale DSM 13146]
MRLVWRACLCLGLALGLVGMGTGLLPGPKPSAHGAHLAGVGAVATSSAASWFFTLVGAPETAWAAEATSDPKALLREIDALEARLEKVADRVKHLTRERNRLGREQARLQRRLAAQKDAYARTKRRALRRLHALAQVDWLRLVAAQGLQMRGDYTLFHGAYALKRLLQQDGRLLDQLASERESLEATQRTLAKSREATEEVLAEMARQREHLGELKEQKILALIRFQDRRKGARGPKAGGESRRKKMGRVPVPGPPFQDLKGRLPLPVSGPIERKTAKKRSPLSSILYNDGVLVRGNPGEAVRAVHDGVVVFADTFRGYGRMMIIDHGNHYLSLMARLGGFLKRTGDRVRAGEPVATLAQGADSSGSILYFELRHKGRPVRVEDWLGAEKSKDS